MIEYCRKVIHTGINPILELKGIIHPGWREEYAQVGG